MTVDSSTNLRKITSSVKEENSGFGGRLLKDEEEVFQFNAWDHVEWTEEQELEALAIIEKQKQVPMAYDKAQDVASRADAYWDEFYGKHENKFFKDRNWFSVEFPELFTRPAYLKEDEAMKILELGCGAGNSVFPVLQHHKSKIHIYACDISSNAVELVKAHPDYDPATCTAFQHDITSLEIPDIEPGSLDVILAIFVISAIDPDILPRVFDKLAKLLKPGGLILFRDYGRYDMAQLRFKPGRMIKDNFYARGDGTQVYFFSQEDLTSLSTGAGLIQIQNAVDRRLLVNRLRQLKMYRVWIQCKWQK